MVMAMSDQKRHETVNGTNVSLFEYAFLNAANNMIMDLKRRDVHFL
jgi:hypothetical protein